LRANDRVKTGSQDLTRPEAFFLDGARGRLFCLFRRSADVSSPASVLVLPAFAEEMNKARRMVALFARQAQDAGVSVLIPDLYGTGDSEGEFGDATVSAWAADLDACTEWLSRQSGGAVSVLAVRFGALLLSRLPRSVPNGGHLALWQPVSSGKVLMNQFLRLKVAGERLGGNAQTDTAGIRAALRVSGRVEIAGYELNQEMVEGIESLTLGAEVAGRFSSASVFEVGTEASSEVTPGLTRAVQLWRAAGMPVSTRTIAGDPFWATTEIATVPALIDETVCSFTDCGISK
jgi:exosortase A-associated hydrolase 2